MPDPITREETFLAAAAGESVTLPAPVTREEMFLAKLAGENVETPTPITRKEMFLEAAAQGGGGGVTVEPLSVSENGTYTAPSGKAYSPVTVDVPQDASEFTFIRTSNNLSNTYGLIPQPPLKKLTLISTYNESEDLNASSILAYMANIEQIEFQSAKAPKQINNAFRENVGLKKVVINSNLADVTSANYLFYKSESLEAITGQPLNLDSVTSVTNTFALCYALQTVRFVADTIKFNIYFQHSGALTDESLVSIANGLNGTVSGKTITLNAKPKARCQTLMGTVADGLFTADASGTVSLTDFITTVKGWTIA